MKTLVEKAKALRPEDDIKSIQPEDHEVMQETERKKREVNVDTGTLDAQGNPVMRLTYEEVTRIPAPIEKNIIDWAAQMAAGVPVEAHALPAEDNAAEQTLYDMVKPGFVNEAWHWRYSSAIDYIGGKGLIDVYYL